MVASPQKIDWLIVGAEGQLARSMLSVLDNGGTSFLAKTRSQLDITNVEQMANLRLAVLPRFVFNGAAWTDVEGAEGAEESATLVNAAGAANLANFCAATGATLIHVSTDYVFSGSTFDPWEEYGAVSPVSAYGRSKAAGERLIQETPDLNWYIIRTAWLYGANGRNFAKTMLRKALFETGEVKVVDDQFGQPTFSDDLAQQIVEMTGKSVPYGIYHGTNSGRTSWDDFAREIFTLAGQDANRVRSISSSDYQSKVTRPSNSVLGHAKWDDAGMLPMRNWKVALGEAIPDLLSALKVEE